MAGAHSHAGLALRSRAAGTPFAPATLHASRLTRGSGRSRRAVQTVAALPLPPGYGYVLGSVASTALVLQWQAVRVAIARRDSGVKYPKMYADGDDEVAMRFNCTQRAHQNTVEVVAPFLALELVLSTTYPVTAAALGMAWNVGRVLYALGYSTGDPNKRIPGVAISNLVQLVMVGIALYAGVKSVIAA